MADRAVYRFIRNIYAGTDPPAQDTNINSNEVRALLITRLRALEACP